MESSHHRSCCWIWTLSSGCVSWQPLFKTIPLHYNSKNGLVDALVFLKCPYYLKPNKRKYNRKIVCVNPSCSLLFLDLNTQGQILTNFAQITRKFLYDVRIQITFNESDKVIVKAIRVNNFEKRINISNMLWTMKYLLCITVVFNIVTF